MNNSLALKPIHKTKKTALSKKDIVLSLLMTLFVVFSIAPDFFEAVPASLSWYIGLAISFVCFLIALTIKQIDHREIIFYSFILLLLLLSSFYNGNAKITIVIQYLRYIFFLIALARVKLAKLPLYLLHLVLCVYLLYCYLILKLEVTEIMANGVSQNAISVHIIMVQILIFIAEKKMFTFKLFISLILAFVVIVWTGCRSGLITISLLTICSYLSTLKNRKGRIIKIILLLFAVAIGIRILSQTELFNKMFEMISTRTAKFSENIRLTMIREFFEAVVSKPLDFLFGPKLSDVPSIHFYNDNPHNSFLNAYSKMGLLGFTVIISMILASLGRYFKQRNFYFILLVAIVIRSFTDVTAFPNLYDVLFFYLIFENFLFKETAKVSSFQRIEHRSYSYEQNC